MTRALILASIVLFVFPLTASAQWVYGDSATKKYFSIECDVEVSAIGKDKLVGFKTQAAAEGAGYSKGEKCSKEQQKPFDWNAYARTHAPVSVKKEIDNVTILYVRNNLDRYIGRVVNLRVTIAQDDDFFPYTKGLRDYSAFQISDGTESGYVYMRHEAAKRLRDQISLTSNGRATGIASIEVRKEFFDISNPWDDHPNYMYSSLQGELLAFKPER